MNEEMNRLLGCRAVLFLLKIFSLYLTEEYPIWWGEAPRIVNTFMESYDFSGKTIIPFCTSDGSGMGSSASNLEQLTSGAVWMEGRRLNGSDSQDAVMEWVNSLGLSLNE